MAEFKGKKPFRQKESVDACIQGDSILSNGVDRRIYNSAVPDAVPNSQMASHFCVSGCGHAASTATRLLWGSDPHANRASWVKATGILYFERALNLIEMLMENNTFF